jgi:chromosome segregation ATPase
MNGRESSQRPNRPKGRTEHPPIESETTLRRLQARGERLLQWFPELRKTWQREGEPNLEALIGHLQTLGGEVSRRAQETGRDLEARAERLLSELERQAVRGLEPLLSRANLASGTELSEMEHRFASLESRLATALADRTHLESRLDGVQSELLEARADASERLRELTVRLSGNDELRTELASIHHHLDAFSKEQVTRSLEIGKLHDRLVRLEMRMGDVLKEQGAQATAHQETARRIADVDHGIAESGRSVEALRTELGVTAAEGRGTDARLTSVVAARNADHDELARLADLLTTVQQTLRQVDLRLGDLGERHTGVREELAGLAARVSHLELAPTRPVSRAMLDERREGH